MLSEGQWWSSGIALGVCGPVRLLDMGWHPGQLLQDPQQSLVPLPVTLRQQAREEMCLCSKHLHPSSDNNRDISATGKEDTEATMHLFPSPWEGSSPGPSHLGSLLILITLN